MCGITGWISADTPIGRDAFERMTDRLAARGPDGRGVWFARNDRIALGHRRLAIVDLSSAGAQPMSHDARGLRLTFNGEIYNHPELRRELEARGCVYRSRCDAETILHAYAEWGDDCVTRLRGIFAFAIWDEHRARLFAARDHLGVKPLYFTDGPRGFAFASQPRAFLDLPGFAPAIAPDAFVDYLTYGVVPGERAAFKGVNKLSPAHTLEWRDGVIRTRQYWSLPDVADIVDGEAARLAVEDALRDAVASQLMSDVPVSMLLSGGIDSSLVTAIATGQGAPSAKAFTLGFNVPASDERAFAAKAAARCKIEHVVEVLEPNDIDGVIDATVEAFDEPFGIDAALPMIAISRFMASHRVKVVLTGDGADELFAGYRHYDDLSSLYGKWGKTTAAHAGDRRRAFLMRLLRKRFTPLAAYTAHNGWIADRSVAGLAGPALRGHAAERWREGRCFPNTRGPVDAGRRCDLATYLPDEILVKVDRATMAYGIEARVPFLDPKLVELAFRISPDLHYRNGERKALLKAVGRRWLPEDILTARKKGFSAPIAELVVPTPERRAQLMDSVGEGPLVSAGFLEKKGVEQSIRTSTYPAGALLQLYLLDRWARRWIWPKPGEAAALPPCTEDIRGRRIA